MQSLVGEDQMFHLQLKPCVFSTVIFFFLMQSTPPTVYIVNCICFCSFCNCNHLLKAVFVYLETKVIIFVKRKTLYVHINELVSSSFLIPYNNLKSIKLVQM